MKNSIKGTIFILIAAVSTLPSASTFFFKDVFRASAHSASLDITYDECVPDNYVNNTDIGDGEDETWYLLDNGSASSHLPHSNGPLTVKYYINFTSEDGQTSWADITNKMRRLVVQKALTDSIKKWNNIYFYCYETSDTIVKQKIINVIQGSQNDYDLIIYPDNSISAYATAGPIGATGTLIDTHNGVNHYHYTKWRIRFRISDHYTNTSISSHILERTGAHEFGHCLGLRDVDSCENSMISIYHHEEILMGYSSGSVLTRQTEITYKDLVGAAITRGFHTDDDHTWIYDAGSSSSSNYKLICSVCNGVKYVNSLANYQYVTYKYCNNVHTKSSGNMFAVASYGDKDYFKCKYCKYVAPFSDLSNQNYSKTSLGSIYHGVTNNVTGLNYFFVEQHTMGTDNNCTGCGYAPHSHSYGSDHYEQYSQSQHKSFCTCGGYVLESHAILHSGIFVVDGVRYAYCVNCNELVNIDDNIVITYGNGNWTTDNGSYILPSGIYVIVDEDLEDYLAGTLVFYDSTCLGN